MSGSTRAIVLTLSTRGAAEVRDALEQMGTVGERALARLDAAAQKAAGTASLPKVTQEATRATGAFGNMGHTIQQAGFQVADFSSQVAGGTSALVALSQQGSQFLGIFGPAGAAAGAALAVGAIAAQFLTAGENAKEAEKAAEAGFKSMTEAANSFKAVLKEVNDLFLTNAQRAAQSANAQRDELRARTDSLRSGLVQRNEGNVTELSEARRYLERLEADSQRQEALRERLRRSGQMVPEGEALTERGNLFQARARVQGLEADISRVNEKLGQLNEEAKRLTNAGRLNSEEFGPTSSDPFGTDNLRASLDKRYAAEQAYAARVRDIQAQLRDGYISSAEAERLTTLATQERGQALESLTEKRKALTQAEKDAADLQQSWDKFWDSADKRSEERVVKEREQRIAEEKREQDRREREAETILRRQQAQAERSTDEVVRYGADMFADMFSTTEGGWDRMWQNMQRTAVAIIARIAAEAVIRPVITPIVSSLFMGSGSATNANGAITGGGFGGLAQSLGLSAAGNYLMDGLGFSSLGSSLSGILGTELFASSTFGSSAAALGGGMNSGAALAGSMSATGGLTLGSALGGVGGGFLAGTMLNSLVGGKSTGGMVGSGAGAAAGALAGTFLFPGVGTILGGILGGAGGGLLGGLFGANEQKPASSVQIAIDENGQLVVAGSRSKGMSDAEGVAQTQSALASLNAAVSGRGLSLAPSNGAVAQTHQGSDARAGADQEEITRVVLSSITGGSEAVMQVIAREIAKGAAASLDQAFSDVDWVRTVYEPLTTTTPAVSAFQQSLDAVNKTFDDAETKAADLGLATSELAARQVQAIDDLIAARDRAYSTTSQGLFARQRSAMGDQLGADLLTFDANAQAQREALAEELRQQGAEGEAFAGQMRLLEDTLWWERKNIAERGAAEVLAAERSAAGSAANVIRSLADYSRSLAVGADSPLSAQDQFAAAQRQFNAVSSAALAGDANSLSSLQNYAQTYLTASRSLYGSTEGYAQAYTRVQDVLGQVGDVNADTLTASFLATQTQDLKVSLVNELQALRAEVASLRREQQQTNAMQGLAA